MSRQHLRSLACTAFTLALGIATAGAQEAEKPEAAADSQQHSRSSFLTEQNLDRSRQDFNPCLEAAAEVRVAEQAYADGQTPITSLLRAERKLTATQIHYLSTSSNMRGAPALRDYLACRGEVTALERGLASTTSLMGKVVDDELPLVRKEVELYQEALKEARRKLLRAEHVWKTASRAEQLRYLNRKANRR